MKSFKNVGNNHLPKCLILVNRGSVRAFVLFVSEALEFAKVVVDSIEPRYFKNSVGLGWLHISSYLPVATGFERDASTGADIDQNCIQGAEIIADKSFPKKQPKPPQSHQHRIDDAKLHIDF